MRILIALILCGCSCTPTVSTLNESEEAITITGATLGIECK